jgi:hypothetical protein
MKRTAALGLSLLFAAVLAGPAGATHTLPDPKPGAERAPCGIHHELAAETIADPDDAGSEGNAIPELPGSISAAVLYAGRRGTVTNQERAPRRPN